MTKTSTSSHIVNLPQQEPAEKVADEADQQNEVFYNSLKPQLNKLMKNPSDETIDKILAYSKKK